MTEVIRSRIEQIRRGKVPEGYKRIKVGIVQEDLPTPEKSIGQIERAEEKKKLTEKKEK